MDTKSEENDTSWSPARLRDHECLTLATDLALLKSMQNLSTRISNQSKCLVADIDSLERDTTSAIVQVENCIQNLNLISTKQFMEKRVYDEEDRTAKKAPQPSPVTSSSASDIVPKVKEGILYGLPAIKSQFSVLQSGLDTLAKETPERDSGYLQRSLPFILGSVDFINNKTIGIQNFSEEPKLEFQGSIRKEKPLSDYREEPVIMPSKLNPHTIPIEQVPSDVESSASDVESSPSDVVSSATDVSRPVSKAEHEETRKITKGFVDVRSELEARLRLPGLEEPATDVVNKETRQALCEENQLSGSPSIDPELTRRVQSYAPPALTFEPPPIPKTKGLFDDSSTESDDESLFGRRGNTEQHSSKSSSIKSVSSSNRIDQRPDGVVSSATQSNPVSTKSSLNVVPSYASQAIPDAMKPKQPISTSNENAINRISSEIPETTKRANLLFASDSEDDLFGREPAFKPQQQVPNQSKPNGLSSVANQTAYPVLEKDSSTETSDRTVSDYGAPIVKHRRDENPPSRNGVARQNSKPRPISSRERSLFSDSESEDDLFGIVQSKANMKPSPQSNVALPAKPGSQSALPENSEGVSVSKENGDENSSEKVKQIPLSTENTRNPSKHYSSTLFSEDEEDDLFASITTSKNQPTAVKLPVPRPKLRSQLHHLAPQGNHPVNNNKPLPGADVSSSGNRDVMDAMQSNAAVDEKTTDPAPSKIPVPCKSLFYSDDDSDDDDLFKTSGEPAANLRKNSTETNGKVDNRQNPPFSAKNNGAEKKMIESQNPAHVGDSRSIEQAPEHVIGKTVSDGIPPKSVPKPSDSNSKPIDNPEKSTPTTSTHLFEDSDDDNFFSGSIVKASSAFPSVKEDVGVKHPPDKLPSTMPREPVADANITATPIRSLGDNPIHRLRSTLSHFLFTDSDGESLFGTPPKFSQTVVDSVLNKNDVPKLDRAAVSSINEAPQMSQSNNHEKKLTEVTRHLPEFPGPLVDPSKLTSRLTTEASPDVYTEKGLLNTRSSPTPDHREQSCAPVTTDIRPETARILESPPSSVTQRAPDNETKPPSRNSKTPPMPQTKPMSSILESSDDDDLFSPRNKINQSSLTARGIPALEATKSATEVLTKDEEAGISSRESCTYGNEPSAANVQKEKRIGESIIREVSPQGPSKAAETSDGIGGTLVNHATFQGTEMMKEKPPAMTKKISLVDESADDNDDLFKIVAKMPSNTAEREMCFQNSKDDLLTSTDALNEKKKLSEKTTSEVDGSNLAKAVEKTVENVRAGKIAALKLSLSQQQNALRFPTPHPGSSSDSVGSAISVIRKPFGGVPLFGQQVLSFVEKQSPDSAQSTPTTPERAERSFQPNPAHVDPAANVNESTSDANPDSLLCAGKTRPRLPASRRPPSRHFRRSRIIENDLDEKELVGGTHENAIAPDQLGQGGASETNVPSSPTKLALEPPVTNNPIGTKGKLFDDSDSSDDELFKPLSSAKHTDGNHSRTNLPSATLNKTRSMLETLPKTPQKTPLSKNLPPSFLDDDSDDDLFAGPSKSHVGRKPVTHSAAKNQSLAATEDPLSRMSE